MTHFLVAPRRAAARRRARSARRAWSGSGRAVALGAILLPWLLYPAFGDVSEALEFGKIWEGLWPVLIGVGLALGLQRLRLASAPRSGGRQHRRCSRGHLRRLWRSARAFETLDARLRQWPAAGVSLLLIVLALLAAGVLG